MQRTSRPILAAIVWFLLGGLCGAILSLTGASERGEDLLSAAVFGILALGPCLAAINIFPFFTSGSASLIDRLSNSTLVALVPPAALLLGGFLLDRQGFQEPVTSFDFGSYPFAEGIVLSKYHTTAFFVFGMLMLVGFMVSLFGPMINRRDPRPNP